jgi:hypothetical protein
LNVKERQILERLCGVRPEVGPRWLVVGFAYLIGPPVIVLVALTDFQAAWAARPLAMAGSFAGLMVLLAGYAALRFGLRFRTPQVILLLECMALVVFAVALFAVRSGQFTAMPVYLGFYLLFAALITYAFVVPRVSLSAKLWRMSHEERAALLMPYRG